MERTSDTPTITKNETASCSIIRETIQSRKIPDKIAEITKESWRHNAKSKYEAILWKLEIACIFKERRFH